MRSACEYLEIDAKHRLGFVANPKRFNVALTRAKVRLEMCQCQRGAHLYTVTHKRLYFVPHPCCQALVIVVGNPQVLVSDPNWEALLRLAVLNGAYTGTAPLPRGLETGGVNGAADEDVASLLQRLVISSQEAATQDEEALFGADEAGARVEGVPMRRVDV